MKKAIVSTYCTWKSYGSILQAFALKTFLNGLGVQSKIVMDEPYPAPPDCKIALTGPGAFAKTLFGRLHCKQNLERYNKLMQFINANIEVEYYNSYAELHAANLTADVFLAGSDQIFHPLLCKPLFFLDYAKPGAKKISYAASMGVTAVPAEKKQQFGRLLGNFSSISVREQDNKPVIEAYTNAPVCTHIDPTLLIPANQWRSLEQPYLVLGKYILVYTIYWDPKLNRELKALSRKTGFQVVQVCTGLNRVFAGRRVLNAGLGEFLWLIDHAEIVVTSSFHGVAMSTVFNKKLVAVVNPNAPSRIQSLLQTVGLTPLTFQNAAAQSINYAPVNQKIKAERERSRAYLQGEILNG